MMEPSGVVGVLALQGSFLEHVRALRRLGVETREVRLPSEMDGIAGLIIPGGESTTILKLTDEYGLREPMCTAVAAGLPVLGTCAGTVCLATDVSSHRMRPLGLLDIAVARNAFGRQVESFEDDLSIAGMGGAPFRGVFIRAPIIERCGPGVQVLARLRDGTVVACRQGSIIATSFHPEFVDDLRMHEYFMAIVRTEGNAVRRSTAGAEAPAAHAETAASGRTAPGRGWNAEPR